MARRHRPRRNPTPEGTALGLIGIGGTIASMFYAATAVARFTDPAEARRRALLAGGLLVGSIALVTVGGEASARRRATT